MTQNFQDEKERDLMKIKKLEEDLYTETHKRDIL
jgi:hypothetical protein